MIAKDDNQKINNPIGDFLILLVCFIAFFPIVFKENINLLPTLLLPIITAIAILVFYIHAYKKLTNLTLFTLLLFSLSVALPLLHFTIYKLNSNNYQFDAAFLKNKSNSLKEEMSHKINLTNLTDLERKKDTIFTKKIKDISTDILLLVDNYIIRKDQRRQPDGESVYFQFYNSSGGRIGSLAVKDSDSTIKQILSDEINKINSLNNNIRNPEKYAYANEFWIESITAFNFGHIKPESYLAIGLTYLQMALGIIFISIVTNTLGNHKKLILEKVK